jgi:predicted ArsR family transcriptional regulator
MDVQALLAPDAGPPIGQSRAHVLDRLRAAGAAVDVREIARSTGLSPNTARFHLDALVAAGLATRASQPHTGPGRPRIVYRAAEGGGQAGPRRYRLLAEMLASLIAGILPDPGQAAADAGRAWGRYLTDRPAPFQRLDPDQAIRRLTTTLEEIGFDPEAPAQGAQQIRLRRCPFREVAESHQDVVCELHLGLMQGALAEMHAPVTADALQPFAEPSLCIAHLGSAEGPEAGQWPGTPLGGR